MKNGGDSRRYPRILDLALTAGRWSVLAGSTAAMIGAAGCEEVAVLQDDGPDVMAFDMVTPGLPPLDEIEPDVDVPDADAHVPDENGSGYELAGDDVPWSPDDGSDVIEPGDAAELPLDDAVEVDPGAPLPGEPPIDVYPGDVIDPGRD